MHNLHSRYCFTDCRNIDIEHGLGWTSGRWSSGWCLVSVSAYGEWERGTVFPNMEDCIYNPLALFSTTLNWHPPASEAPWSHYSNLPSRWVFSSRTGLHTEQVTLADTVLDSRQLPGGYLLGFRFFPP